MDAKKLSQNIAMIEKSIENEERGIEVGIFQGYEIIQGFNLII